MSDRRKFIKKATLGTIGISTIYACKESTTKQSDSYKAESLKSIKKPLIISTWNHGLPANEET